MQLVKYRTSKGKAKEIMVESNITVSRFMELVNKKSNVKFTKSVFRGKTLNGDDLICNHITNSDHVLILLSNSKDDMNYIMDFDEEIKDNNEIKKVKNIVSSSILNRTENNQKRKGFMYTFTIYTTATSNSMFYGNKMEFSLNDDYYKIYDDIKNLVSNFEQVNYNFDLHLFLPGGVYFKSGTLLEYYTNTVVAHDNLYVVITSSANNSYNIDSKIENPCSCSETNRSKILSPIFSSSSAGLTQIASLLGYIFYGGQKSEHILLSLAKITRFAPLVVNLFRLMENRPLNVLNIISITSPLYTLFRSMLPEQIKNENVFEYTLNFLSVFDVISNTEYLNFFELNTSDEKDCKEMKHLVNYFKNTEQQQQHVIIWTVDTINPDFQSILLKPEFSTIENIFTTIKTFQPVSPTSLHYIFYPTFVSCSNDNKSVILFLKKNPEKENFVSIIDPFEGHPKETSIEELSDKMNINKKDEIFTLVDPNQIDQIVFIIFDRSNQKILEFLKEFVKKSRIFRVSSFYGLISFGSEVKILQQLTLLSSEFFENLNEIKQQDECCLYDAINIAQQQIIDFIKRNSCLYRNSRLRIIVFANCEDNKSEKKPYSLINDLIFNEIVVDTVLFGKSFDCCAISKLTGGLCFNLYDCCSISKLTDDLCLDQEAFLNIKMRHMKPLLYSKITQEIYDIEKTKYENEQSIFDSYAPNQMIINAKSKVNLATPNFMIKIQERIKTYRMMRSFFELDIISRSENEKIIVYSLYATPEEWRIFIKGPKNTPFENKWLNLYMILPQNYPIEPPRFRFLTIPFHPNVSSEGTVIFSLIDKNYTPSLRIESIIEGIIELLMNPDKNYIINKNAMKLFINNKTEFLKQQEAGETGCNDYTSFLEDIKIYKEITDDFEKKSNLISLTREAVKEAVYKGSQIDDHCLLDIDDFELIDEIDSGQFGLVYLIADKNSNQEFAAKIPLYDIENDDDDDDEEVKEEVINYIKEVNVISIFIHAAITKLYGYCLNDFENNKRRVIIMEYVPNGNLQKIINEEKKGNPRDGWDKTQKLINLYGIASGMAYSVSYGITHSDLKPENILMTNDLYPKITDFDSARIAAENNEQSFNMSKNEISSPLYTAPEIISFPDYKKFAEKSDVYAYSIISFQILTSKTPFSWYRSEFKLFNDIVAGKRPQIPDFIPKHYRELIVKCWHKDPNERPTFKEIAERLKSEEFLNDENIDQIRFEKYLNYTDYPRKSYHIFN